MGKDTKGGPGHPGPPERKISSLKVRKEDQRVVAKIAAHRDLSIEELFMEDDVRSFFAHLLIEEMAKEQKGLQGKPRT